MLFPGWRLAVFWSPTWIWLKISLLFSTQLTLWLEVYWLNFFILKEEIFSGILAKQMTLCLLFFSSWFSFKSLFSSPCITDWALSRLYCSFKKPLGALTTSTSERFSYEPRCKLSYETSLLLISTELYPPANVVLFWVPPPLNIALLTKFVNC